MKISKRLKEAHCYKCKHKYSEKCVLYTKLEKDAKTLEQMREKIVEKIVEYLSSWIINPIDVVMVLDDESKKTISKKINSIIQEVGL